MSTVVDEWLALVDAVRGEIPAELLLAVIERVSGGDQARTGPAGGRGLMQIDPGTAEAAGVDPADLYNPEINLSLAVQLLEQRAGQLTDAAPWLLEQPEDLEPLAVGAYFYGPAKILEALRAVPSGSTAEDVLGRPGLERIEAWVGDVMARAASIQLEIVEGIAREDEPIGGPGEAPPEPETAGPAAEPEAVAERDWRPLWWALGIGAAAVGAFFLLRKGGD